MPIMSALCSKPTYYASILLDALACLLWLKLCQHNRRRPSTDCQPELYRPCKLHIGWLLSDSINHSCTSLKSLSVSWPCIMLTKNIIQCITMVSSAQPIIIFNQMQIITIWALGRVDAMHKNFPNMLALCLMLFLPIMLKIMPA